MIRVESEHLDFAAERIPTSWRRRVLGALRGRMAPRVLRTRDLAAITSLIRGEANELAVARMIATLCGDGHLRRVWKGLYVNMLAVPPVIPEEVAASLRRDAVVSLQSVLGDRVANNPSTVVTAVVPIRRNAPIPSVGEVKTDFGVFRFHAMAEDIFTAGALEDRLDQTRPRYARATAERAFCDYLYFSQTRRRSLPPPPMDIDISELRMPVVRRLAKCMGVSNTLEIWCKRKIEHDSEASIISQASADLGF